MKMKVCGKCGKLKTLDSFYAKTRNKDGLQDWCKECQDESRILRHERQKKQKRQSLVQKIYYYRTHKNLECCYDRGNDKITFKCLSCGREVVLPIKKACSNNFKCNSCKSLKRESIRHIENFTKNIKLEQVPTFKPCSLTFPLAAKKVENPFHRVWRNIVNSITKRNVEKQVSLDISKIRNINFTDGKMVVTLGEDLHPQMQNSKK